MTDRTVTEDVCLVCQGLCCGEIPRLREENERLREALRIVAEGTRCPELFPDLDMESHEWRIQAQTAEVAAIAALETRP